jgi:ubiquinone/menaquinone biosynthesis C-methylase UbiE
MNKSETSFTKHLIERFGTLGDGVEFMGSQAQRTSDDECPIPALRAVGPCYQGASLYETVSEIARFNGPVVISGGLEREPDPWGVVRAVAERLQGEAILVLESHFTPPSGSTLADRWRFTPSGLAQLALNAQLMVLESGWVPAEWDGVHQQGQGGVVGDRCFVVAARHSRAPRAANTTVVTPVDAVANEKAAVPANGSKESEVHNGPVIQRSCIVIVHTFYEKFLQSHYQNSPALDRAPYAVQLKALHDTCFGDSDFYSRGLREAGCDAHDIVVNCAPLQQAWAREQGVAATGWQLVVEQLRRYAPQVVYVHDMAAVPQQVLSVARELGAMIVGQIACEPSREIPFASYDIVVSSFPHFVDAFRKAGLTSYYQPLAFDRRMLDLVGMRPYEARDIEVSFVGGISSAHHHGTVLLEQLARSTPLQIWGYGAEHLAPGSVGASRHRGEVWGTQMFDLLSRSKITVNRHSEAAAHNANNMRLFEATGAGALLITDYKANLHELFELEREVVSYRSVEECIEKIRYYQAHPEEAARIAAAGQHRTLTQHSYSRRMRKSAEILNRHLLHRALRGAYEVPTSVSEGYVELSPEKVTEQLVNGSKNPAVAQGQRGLVQEVLAAMYRGEVAEPFRIAVDILAPVVKNGTSVLDVGCSSGYYYEALEYLLKCSIAYVGCDYSDAMISQARLFYPHVRFDVADGAALPHATSSFELVISGCVLPYCPNYPQQIAELCRVARSYICLHRMPISTSGKERLLEKYAYGVPTMEIWFAENTLLGLFSQHGFEFQNRIEYHRDEAQGFANVTYLLQKRC